MLDKVLGCPTPAGLGVSSSLLVPSTLGRSLGSGSSAYFSPDMCSAAHKADKNKVLTECLNANFPN